VTVIITLFVSECWHKRHHRHMHGKGGCPAGEFKKEWKKDRGDWKKGAKDAPAPAVSK
jgi:hypothetical protein